MQQNTNPMKENSENILLEVVMIVSAELEEITTGV
jgi:hypothetical protein